MRAALTSLLVLVGVGLASTASADAVLQGRVIDLLGAPVAGARVHVMTGSAHKVVESDAAGYYRVDLDGSADTEVSVVIAAGSLHTFRRGTIKDGTVKHLDLEVEVAEGEIIRIIDQKPPAVPPQLSKDLPRLTPPYSDQAVARDAWAKAWLLLDVDETGKVRRVKLLKRPGFDLDDVAVKEAMKLRFDPALDEHGKPMRTHMLWAMEWPSHGWLLEHNGTATRLPAEGYTLDPLLRGFGGLGQPMAPPTGASALARVPCAGSGPLNLDLRYPVYRDCSKPNLDRAASLPWLDGTAPVPAKDPARYALLARTRVVSQPNRLAQVGVTAGTVALAAGFAASFLQWDKYKQRNLDMEAGPKEDFSLYQYKVNEKHIERWRQVSLVTGLAAIGGAVITGFVWLNPPTKRFTVLPESRGASVSFLSRF